MKNDIFSLTENYLNNHYKFRRNTISFEIEYRKTSDEVEEWKPANLSDIFIELEKASIRISENKLKALFRSNFITDYNPFLAYFENLKLEDEEKDYIAEFSNFITLENKDEHPQFYNAFRKMFIRCVACALGYHFNKQCFVLVSPSQNIGKTRFIKFLCPEDLKPYYTEEMSFDKDGLIALSSNFIINLDELSAIEKSDLNTLKTYFSKDMIKVRLPYEPKATNAKRVSNFFASTNNEDFLNDPTGSVRWVAFSIKKINFDYSQKVNINNIWGQAYKLFLAGESGNLTQDDITENELRNTKFTKITSEMELVNKYCEQTDNDFVGDFVTGSEIQEKLSQLSSLKINSNNLGKALQTLGFKRCSKRVEGKSFPVYGYYVIFKC
ncbi:MAG: virulence-associated E family protein [Raineya sp.]|jgi:predicted P-loop ATPase|nr:virulence-associated E family protein [Raineya sp.]